MGCGQLICLNLINWSSLVESIAFWFWTFDSCDVLLKSFWATYEFGSGHDAGWMYHQVQMPRLGGYPQLEQRQHVFEAF